jgi:hypothetical protein
MEGLSKDSIEAMMEIPSVAVNRVALSIRGDLGTARLTFGEDNVQGAPTHHRVAVSMPLPVLQSLYNLIGGTIQQMQAEHAAAEAGTFSAAKN